MISDKLNLIIPVHKVLNEEELELFKKAVGSVGKMTVKPKQLTIVYPSSVEGLKEQLEDESIYADNHDNVVFYQNTKTSDFQTQINEAVTNTEVEYFSILEFDDEMAAKYIENVDKYSEFHKDTVFLPIIIDTDTKDAFISFSNESAWAKGFTEEIGFIDSDVLERFQNYNIDGMVISRKDFLTIGGFKKNMKVAFIPEFFMRLTSNSIKLMVIPKFGYKHTNARENSLFTTYKNEMRIDEIKWYLNKAKQEYLFDIDRELNFE